MTSTIKGFDDYLESLPPITFRRLYQQPATALAIFRRMLPNLAKVFVTTLLFNGQSIPLADLEAWVRPESYRAREDAFGKLRRLHIINEQAGQVALDSIFQKNFRLALTGGGDHNSFGVPVAPDEKHANITIEDLDLHATQRFEAILHYMVGHGHNEKPPSQGVVYLLESSGMMEKGTAHRSPQITKTGFSFLLQEGISQIWVLMIQYLEMSQSLGMEKTDVLHFLLMLGSLELGQAYLVEHLPETQKRMLRDLRDYGIIYQKGKKSDRFYPTRLATNLTSDSAGVRSPAASMDSVLTQGISGGSEKSGFIIIETNYRVYAYTDSPLQISVLNLFARLTTRYPGLVAGRISRRSIQQAIKTGITSEQIINYLTVHAHPQMKKNALILPPTVVDQIRLWQIEGERMKTESGYLFREFSSAADFEDTARYADELGVLKYKNTQKRCMFVSRHEQIADWLKRKAVAAQNKHQQGIASGSATPKKK